MKMIKRVREQANTRKKVEDHSLKFNMRIGIQNLATHTLTSR